MLNDRKDGENERGWKAASRCKGGFSRRFRSPGTQRVRRIDHPYRENGESERSLVSDRRPWHFHGFSSTSSLGNRTPNINFLVAIRLSSLLLSPLSSQLEVYRSARRRGKPRYRVRYTFAIVSDFISSVLVCISDLLSLASYFSYFISISVSNSRGLGPHITHPNSPSLVAHCPKIIMPIRKLLGLLWPVEVRRCLTWPV